MKIHRLLVLLAVLFAATIAMAQKPGDAVILYDNDVHCSVEGYPVMAGLRDSLERQGCDVAVVSAGDFLFGGPVGASSKGEYIIRMMNAVGYDVATLGNHEFDYGMTQLKALQDRLNATMLCCNLSTNSEPRQCPFPAYEISTIAGMTVGFVGVTTPTTLNTSSPLNFMNQKGEYAYNFSADRLAEAVQAAVDFCRRAGADVVVMVSHLGDSDGEPTSVEIASQITDIDLILDAHDHHLIQGRRVALKDGRQVLLSSTGAHFAGIGMAVISPNKEITTQVIPVGQLREKGCVSPAVSDTLAAIMQIYEAKGGQVVAKSEYRQVALEDGIRIVRLRETNLGDLVADAFRSCLQTNIGWVNSGGLRADIPAGEITHNQLFEVCPFGNRMCVIRVTGKEILDALETAVREYPKADGCFPQVSGITFDFDTSIASSVVLDEHGRFVKVSGRYRVSHVRVGGRRLRKHKTYTIAGTEYVLQNGGDGIFFPQKQSVWCEATTDLEVVERYVKEALGGVIGRPYDKPQDRIVAR